MTVAAVFRLRNQTTTQLESCGYQYETKFSPSSVKERLINIKNKIFYSERKLAGKDI